MSRPGVMALVTALAFLLAACACQWALYLTAKHVLRDALDDGLLATGRLATTRLDLPAHAAIQREDQLNTPEYLAVVEPFRKMLSALPDIRYIYTARMSPDGIRFAVDAALPEDADGDGVIDQAAVGELYEDPDPAMVACFESGESTVSDAPYADKWGTFVSSFTPVRDASGAIECVIGVDIDASRYLERIATMRRALGAGLLVAALSSALAGCGVFFFQRSRVRSLRTLQLNEARFHGFFNHGMVGMAILDRHGSWSDVNQSLCDILGYTRDELASRPPIALTHPADRAAEEQLLHEIVGARREGYVVEKRFVRPDGSIVHANFSVRCVRHEHGVIDHYVAVLVDISQSKKTKEALVAALRQSEASLQVFSSVAAAPALAAGQLEEFAQLVTEQAAQALCSQRASVWLFGADGADVRCIDLFEAAHHRHSGGDATVARVSTGELDAFRRSRYLEIREPLVDPHTAGLVETYIKPNAITSMLDVVIRSSGRDLGIFSLECIGNSRAWEPREISLACQLADQLAIAILNREQHQTTLDLMRARDEAQAASRAKSEFLAVMSHEIRTPMNGVIGFTNLLGDTRLEANQLKYVSTIRASADALMRVINDILDFSKIEAGHVRLEREPFNARDVVADAIAVLQPRAAEKKLSLAFDWSSDVPRRWVGDQARLRQVLVNLAGNAIKFTQQGAVLVRVQAGDSGFARISVVDTGIGIAAEAQPRLFTKFTQADSSTTRRFGGTGLGLAISKQLIDLMGGSIGLESEPGRGSIFWFTHPLPAPDEPVEAHSAPLEPHVSGRPRVLLADDTEINQVLVVEMLKHNGVRVDAVSSGDDAVKRAAEVRYDLILMDCQMPGMDGFEATRAIRARENAQTTASAPVPIVGLAADTGSETIEKCRLAGMNDCLAKPLRSRPLRETVLRLLPPPAPTAS